MVKSILVLFCSLLLFNSCEKLTKVNVPLEEITVKVGQQIIIDFFDLGITSNACNYTLREIPLVESIIPIEHIAYYVDGLDKVYVTGKIRGVTRLRLEYENCSQNPFLRNKYIQTVDIIITE